MAFRVQIYGRRRGGGGAEKDTHGQRQWQWGQINLLGDLEKQPDGLVFEECMHDASGE